MPHRATGTSGPGSPPSTISIHALRNTLQLIWRPAILGLLLIPTAQAQHVQDTELTSLGMDDVALTPDGRFAVLRMTTAQTVAVVRDLQTGAEIAQYQGSAALGSGPSSDSVAVTATRAVIVGSNVQILDLTVPGTARLAETFPGEFSHDVAIDALERFACVRGGAAVQVIDLVTGAVLLDLASPNVQSTSAVDSIAVTADHAVALESRNGETTVAIIELAPPAGGPPRAVYQSPPNERLGGDPHDLATSPDGQWCAVRSDDEVALYRLDGSNTRLVWKQTPAQPVAPFADSAMDSIVMTDSWIFTFGRSAIPVGWSVLEAYNLLGARASMLQFGDPHDIDLTPDEARLVTRTSQRLGVVDISAVAVGGTLQLGEVDVTSIVTGFGAGLDSIALTPTHAAAMFVRQTGPIGRIYRIDGLVPVFENNLQLLGAPQDVDFTPDGTRALFVSRNGVQVFDMRTRTVTLSQTVIPAAGWPTWSDGVAANDAHAVALGVGVFNSTGGWTTMLDLFDEPRSVCPSLANSTGRVGTLVATGSSRPAANDLTLWARDLPPSVTAFYAYGALGAPFRFGDGVLCLAGPVVGRFAPRSVQANGTLRVDLDQAAGSTGAGTFLAGTTWLFQLVHRDPTSPLGFNATNGIEVPFLN